MNWAKLFALCLCGCLIVERHGALGQCPTGETLNINLVLCATQTTCASIIGTDPITGTVIFGIATGNCVVDITTGVVTVPAAADAPCTALIVSCTADATTTTTTAAAVDSSIESGSSSRRR